MRRSLAVIGPAVARGVPVVGLEPSCLLTFRDEMPALLGDEWSEEQARQVMLFEAFISARLAPQGGSFALPLAPLRQKSSLLPGPRHQKPSCLSAPLLAFLSLSPAFHADLVTSSRLSLAR